MTAHKTHSQILVELIDEFFNEYTEMTESDYSEAIYEADLKFAEQEKEATKNG